MEILEEIGGLLLEAWDYLITDDLISFYVFFTTIFAEIAYLFAFKGSIAVVGTIILFAYIANILICGYIQGEHEGYRQELYATIAYDVICIAIFIIGCIINFKLSIIITLIPIITTAIAIYIRNFQDSVYLYELSGINKIVDKIVKNKIGYVISQIIVIGGPFIAFVVMFAMIPQIPLILKVIIPILYFIVMPLFSELEDNLSTKNIFELGYDVMYDGKESYWDGEKFYDIEVHKKNKSN